MNSGNDLVVIGLSGVQRFIAEAQSTADLANASDIASRLAAVAAHRFAPEDLVLPASADPEGMPNRIVALTPAGTGQDLARAAVRAVREEWDTWVGRLFGRAIEVPGFPEVFWSVAGPDVGNYARQWEDAHVALAARKRLRGFDAPEYAGRRPCALAPRWAAEPQPPRGVPRHERDAGLSAAGWVKRRWHATPGLPAVRSSGFPSTSSIASAPYRAAVLDRLGEPEVRSAAKQLRAAVRAVAGDERFRAVESPVPALRWDRANTLAEWLARGAGWWVYPTVWQEASLRREYATDGHTFDDAHVERGRAAARALHESVGWAEPTPYYAVLALDLDGMGAFLSRDPVDAGRHRAVSARLGDVARAQRTVIEERSGVCVYAGGDDLLAFLPAAAALDAVQACRDALPGDGSLPSASAAVLFVHSRSALRHAVNRTRSLLEAAKSVPGKNAVAVGFATGSGTAFHTVRPWSGDGYGNAVERLQMFLPADAAQGAGLSPRLVADLWRHRRGLAELASASDSREVYRKEVTRLVLRHGGSRTDADTLVAFGFTEYADSGSAPVPVDAARVAVFLRGESR
ncbi:hypothetical protein NI17_020380 [Thermobifida halotolerans]|uniref:GGDEF domain-containing protein n=1 Tax=Thermobifida halotolerans TaxID=483545 RepID=A0AA97LW24_9ACTN|nr:type III-B CRISPR-associated protein Cas10/Cmr2 [Thermobifida halotolerans]UOE19085.1 hypothetical protein NI17_020380 [Thermobifida halotolerans]